MLKVIVRWHIYFIFYLTIAIFQFLSEKRNEKYFLNTLERDFGDNRQNTER